MQPASRAPAPPAEPTGPRPGGGPGPLEVGRLQRRTLATLISSNTVGGAGLAIGVAVGALLAAEMGGTAISGLGQSAMVIGAALTVIPSTRLMTNRGRRFGLALAYLIGVTGAALVVLAAAWDNVPLLFAGLLLFGGGSTGGFQSRYAAVDLAPPDRRARHLSVVVWATAVGSVAGPNLAQPADESLRRFGVATYAGPFVYSGIAFLLAASILLVALRPDPLLTARALPAAGGSDRTGDGSATPPAGLRAAWREVVASPGARLGIGSMAVGHVVMVALMAMTPVHIGSAGHGDTLRIVGLVIGAHIAGMYVLAPVTGWFTDRFGSRPVIVTGVLLHVTACTVAGLSGHSTAGLTVGLFLLGMGWSATMVAGSTLVTASAGLGNRASVQGLSDIMTGLSGATAGALAGLVVAWSSYAVLTVAAAVTTIPLLAAALRPSPAPRAPVSAPAIGVADAGGTGCD